MKHVHTIEWIQEWTALEPDVIWLDERLERQVVIYQVNQRSEEVNVRQIDHYCCEDGTLLHGVGPRNPKTHVGRMSTVTTLD